MTEIQKVIFDLSDQLQYMICIRQDGKCKVTFKLKQEIKNLE